MSPGSCPRGGTLGCPGGGGVKIFFKHCHVVYQIDVDDEKYRMQVKFSSWGQTGDLGGEVKRSISLNLTTISILRFLYQTLCAFLQIKY